MSIFALVSLLLCYSLLPAHAQQTIISGVLTDYASGEPVPGADVYVSNSTYSTVTDKAGRFTFDRFAPLPADLSLFVVGYETVTLKVTADNAHALQVALRRKAVQLDEVQISAPERNGWKKYGARFMEELVGWSDYAAACKLQNKEVVQFRFDKKEGILKAWAEKPLLIRNNAMGYDIVYQLEDFELDMYQNKLFYKGYAYFRELPAPERKLRQFRKNRLAAFNGSFRHFVQALYTGNALAEGFEIRRLKRIYEKDAGAYIPVRTDTLRWNDKRRLAQLVKEIFPGDTAKAANTLALLDTWRNDTGSAQKLWFKGQGTLRDAAMVPVFVFAKYGHAQQQGWVKYYETKDTAGIAAAEAPEVLERLRGGMPRFGKQKQLLNLLYNTLVPLEQVVTRKGADVLLQFPDFLQVTYTRETEELPYLQGNASRGPYPQEQVSVFSLRDGNRLHLLGDGNFYDAYDLLLEQYWAYEKLDKLLPLDYHPPAR